MDEALVNIGLEPLGNGVLYLLEKPPELVRGLVLPGKSAEKMSNPIGKALVVGPECKRIKAGDRFLFFAGGPNKHTLVYKEQEYGLINEDYIPAKITEPA